MKINIYLNPSMTLGSKFQLLPRKKGFKFILPFKAFTNVRCNEAGRMLRIKDPYGASTPAKCLDLKARTVHRGRKNVKN